MAADYVRGNIDSISGSGVPSGLFIADIQDWHKYVQLDSTPIFNGISKGSGPDVPIDKATWGWSPQRPKHDTLAEALDNSETGIDVTNGELYQIGNIIKFRSGELARVTGIATNTLTVVRGYAGTTAAVQDSGSGVVILGTAFAEFGNYEDTTLTQGETDYNYHQIFQYSIPFSHRAEVIPTYETLRGYNGQERSQWAAEHLMNSEVPLDLEYTLIQSTARQAGTASLSGVMGGIRTSTFIGTTDTSLGGVPLTPKILLDFIQDMKYASKEPIGKQIICHPTVARYMYSWFHTMREMNANSTGAVATYTTKIDTPFGIFEIVPVHTWVEPGAAAAVDPLDEILICDLKDYKLTPLSSKSGWKMYSLSEGELDFWGTEVRVRGDYTLRAGNPYTKGLLGGFSVTDSDYPAMI